MQKYYDDAFRDISTFGSSWFMGLITLVSIILGNYKFAIYIITGFILSYIITATIRLFYFKNRPKKEKYESIFSKLDAASFPSNHSIRAMYMAIITGSYFNSLILTIILSIGALFVAYSRIYIKKHYYVDIVSGLIMGGILAYLVMLFV